MMTNKYVKQGRPYFGSPLFLLLKLAANNICSGLSQFAFKIAHCSLGVGRKHDNSSNGVAVRNDGVITCAEYSSWLIPSRTGIERSLLFLAITVTLSSIIRSSSGVILYPDNLFWSTRNRYNRISVCNTCNVSRCLCQTFRILRGKVSKFLHCGVFL